MLQIRAPDPPVACTGSLYDRPTRPGGSVLVVMFGGAGGLIVIDSAWTSESPAASCTRTINDDVPATVGVPEISPFVEFNVKPAGSAPPMMLQVSAPVPPVASTGWLYC